MKKGGKIIASLGIIGAIALGATQPASIPEIQTMETDYFKAHGHYLQVEPMNKKPDYTVDTLPLSIPDNVRIDVYQAKTGFGYQIITDNASTIDSVGFGVEAQARTYTLQKPPKFISSTTTP